MTKKLIPNYMQNYNSACFVLRLNGKQISYCNSSTDFIKVMFNIIRERERERERERDDDDDDERLSSSFPSVVFHCKMKIPSYTYCLYYIISTPAQPKLCVHHPWFFFFF